MKKIILILVLQWTTATVFSQVTRTTVANGTWLSPATWDCACIPMPWDNIVVNHSVSMDTSWYSTAAVTVNANGSISEGSSLRQWAVSGGSFVNNGTVNISRVSVTGGTFTNNDSLRINLAFYVSSVFDNSGRIVDVDSFSNDGIFKNNTPGNISCVLYSNVDSIVNDGIINAYAHTNLAKSYNNGQLNFTDFTNSGLFENKATVSFNNFTNASQGIVNNKSVFSGSSDFLNIGVFTNTSTASVTVNSDFANADSSADFAHFINDGYFIAGDNWLNIDSISGSGSFCVNDSSANTGIMSGSFDFCDNTPPSSSPYIDWNSGTISPGITYCTVSCGLGTGEEKSLVFQLYPNPCSYYLQVQGVEGNIFNIRISDMLGRIVWQEKNYEGYGRAIDVSSLADGIYIVEAESERVRHCSKICIRKP